MDYSSGSSVHGILRILEWAVIPFSRGSSQARDWTRSPTLHVHSLPPEPPGKPQNTGVGGLTLLQQIFPKPGTKLGSPAFQVDSLPAEHCQAPIKIKVLCCSCLVTKSCPTLCDLMVYSPPGSSVHGVLQARILEWVAIFFSRGSSQPRDQSKVSCTGRQILYHWETGKPQSFSAGGFYMTFKPHGNCTL